MDHASTCWGNDRWMRGRSVRSASVWALAWVFGVVCFWMLGPNPAWAQDAQPVRLIELIGPRAVFDGEVVNYRARVDDASTKPVGFLWDFGDGIASEGTLVAHRYRTPGVYTVTLVAYNTAGRDTLRARIRVTEQPDEPAPVAAETEPTRSAPRATSTATPTPEDAAPQPISRADVREQLFGHAPIQPATTGYTWILVSDLWNERIQRTLLQYRLQGIRVEIMAETQGRGSRAYRIIAGHFPTIGQALMARSMLNLGDQTASLHSFAPDGLQLATANLADAIKQLPQRDRRWLADLTRTPTPLVADAQSTERTRAEPAPNSTAIESGTRPPTAPDATPNPAEENRAEERLAETRTAETNATASASSRPAGAARVAMPEPVTAAPPAYSPSPTGLPVWVWAVAGMLASMTGAVAAFLWYGLRGTEPVNTATVEDNTHDPPAAKKAWPPIVLQQTDRRQLPIRPLTLTQITNPQPPNQLHHCRLIRRRRIHHRRMPRQPMSLSPSRSAIPSPISRTPIRSPWIAHRRRLPVPNPSLS